MGFTSGSVIQCSLRMQQLGSAVFNVWQYQITNVDPAATAATVAQGWWDRVKATYRPLVHQGYGAAFFSVLCQDLSDPEGEYGEYAVPAGEQAGTRTQGNDSELTASFIAVGVRLTVPSRSTRPGQKRFGFLIEDDIANNNLTGALPTALTSHMLVMTQSIPITAPLPTADLIPVVVRRDAFGAVTAFQDVSGFSINTRLTTQVSRRLGRGI